MCVSCVVKENVREKCASCMNVCQCHLLPGRRDLTHPSTHTHTQVSELSLLRSWPNTYTYTKAMAEWMIVNERGDLPLAIIRPSIIGGALHEPVPGAWSVCVVVECTCVRMCHLNFPLCHAFLSSHARTICVCVRKYALTYLLAS
jgi:hypothetical protein